MAWRGDAHAFSACHQRERGGLGKDAKGKPHLAPEGEERPGEAYEGHAAWRRAIILSSMCHQKQGEAAW